MRFLRMIVNKDDTPSKLEKLEGLGTHILISYKISVDTPQPKTYSIHNIIGFGGYPIFETGMFSLGFIFASIIFLFAIEDNTGVEI